MKFDRLIVYYKSKNNSQIDGLNVQTFHIHVVSVDIEG